MQDKTSLKCERKTEEPEMHAFIILWLFFGIVMEIIQILYSTIEYVNYKELYETPLFVSGVICSILTIIGKAMLLNWHRSGFYLIISAVLATTVYNVTCIENENIEIVSPYIFISIVILFAVLNIKCNGITFWKAMQIKKNIKKL